MRLRHSGRRAGRFPRGAKSALFEQFLLGFGGYATALPDPLARSERLPLLALPISAARMLSPGIVCAVVRLPIVRMNHNVGAGRIVISAHRMPAGGSGLIADDGRRRAVALNRYRRCASRRARRRSLSGGWRRSCECRKSRGGQCGNQETFHRKLLWLDPPDPLGSCRANATFLAFVPGCRVDCLPAMTAGTIAACCGPKLSL